MSFASSKIQNEYQQQWYADRRKAWFDANGPCVKCGSFERLEVDHIDESQKVNHRVWSWSEKRRSEELAKCQVLCYQCHLKKTVKFLGKLYRKMSDAELIEAKRLKASGLTFTEIGKLLGYTRHLVSHSVRKYEPIGL
jgi:5-methylcytosine-specific restriction endonuclease McrA